MQRKSYKRKEFFSALGELVMEIQSAGKKSWGSPTADMDGNKVSKIYLRTDFLKFGTIDILD